jgi:hypothetical protein
MVLFTIFNISSQPTRIKRRVNERKCVLNMNTHSLSLSQNAKIGFMAFTGAQTRPHVTKPNAYSISKTPNPVTEIMGPQYTELGEN